ncbi:MAG: hypothetical protein AB1422_14980 [bacterium]
MDKIYFERFDLTFYDDDDPILIKKNIETLSNFADQQGLFVLVDWFAKEMRRKRYKSYFMNSLKNLVTLLAGKDYDKFFRKRIKLKGELRERELNKEYFQNVDKVLKKLLLE